MCIACARSSKAAARRSPPCAGSGTALKRPRPDPETQRSLFGEILDWMLAPLLFVWPLSIAVTHFFSVGVANFPYDQALREQVRVISQQLEFGKGEAPRFTPGAT